MKIEDLKIGMKVKVVADNGFYYYNVGKVGFISELDEGSGSDVKVIFEDGTCDWGNHAGIELVEDGNNSPSEQQLLKDLIKNMEKALNGLDLESLETLSKVYQRIK